MHVAHAREAWAMPGAASPLPAAPEGGGALPAALGEGQVVVSNEGGSQRVYLG